MKRFVLAVPLLVTLGCDKAEKPAEKAESPSSIAVHTVRVAKTDWASGFERTGTVQARTQTVLSSKVMGYVREVRVSVGDRVKPGQVLVVLDSRDLDAQHRSAVAQREEAKSALAEAANAVASAKASLDLAQSTHRRMSDLFVKTSISNQEMDESNARLSVAQAAYDAALSRKHQVESKITQADEGVKAAEIAASYAVLAAPYAGIITDKPVQPGILASPGTPLLTVEREGAYRVEVPVEQSQIGAVKLRAKAIVSVDGISSGFETRVTEIVPTFDAASRSFTVKVDVPSATGLRSGMFARVQFPGGVEPVLAVPAGALVEHGDLPSLFVVENGVAHTRLVTVGRAREATREILSGLSEGEQVVMPVPPGLRDGSRVETRQ